ncbi:MAG: extracellular solute-binding protein [Gaiellaceae bacterium MAG52_C11]|nr:extracellular solute-binding protein [Candidatus Gaiellasilicea maunaloa]
MVAEAMLGPFTKANPRLKVNVSVAAGSDEIRTKLIAGFDADVVEVCTRDTTLLVDANQLLPLDTKRLTHWKTLSLQFRTKVAGVRANNRLYMVPSHATTAPLIYNPQEVPFALNSYKQLFEDPRLKGKVTIRGLPHYIVGLAALALGYKTPYNNFKAADLAKVRAYYREHRSQFRTFYTGDADWLNLYRSGEIAASQGFPDFTQRMKDENIPVRQVNAKEGTMVVVCGLGIAKDAKNIAGAYRLLNWFSSPYAGVLQVRTYNRPLVANTKSKGLLSQAIIARAGGLDQKLLDNAIVQITPPNYNEWVDTWNQIRAGG